MLLSHKQDDIQIVIKYNLLSAFLIYDFFQITMAGNLTSDQRK
jgi:hypothetical protein